MITTGEIVDDWIEYFKQLEDVMDWFFDGLGTELLSLVVGAAGGGLIGFRVGRRRSKFSQSQEAGHNSTQYQIGKQTLINNESVDIVDIKRGFRQQQKSGDNSEQIQFGGQGND
jgi:hypothetical protein